MQVIYDRDNNTLTTGGIVFTVTNEIRNELNGRRQKGNPKEVVFSIIDGIWGPAYMPRQFPKGNWHITSIEYTQDPVFAPVKIKTNAKQEVTVWSLGTNGGYDQPTDKIVIDSGYHFHYSANSKTTQGCGRMDSAKAALKFAKLCQMALDTKEEILLKVI